MQRTCRARGRTTAVLFALLLAVVLAVAAAVGVSDEAEAHRASAREQLAELRVKPAGSMVGYSREKFPHWSDAREYNWTLPSGTPDPGSCDARDAALIRDGRDEVVGSGCYVERGRWFDPYTGKTYYMPSDIDVDHVVPLANAWRSGASSWTTVKRERFANVPMDVLSVEDNANASKGDKGPEAWKPPRAAYHCTYARKWIGIKHNWTLSVTGAEKTALSSMLSTC
ncbi:DUF1524 domain-containing protein [Rubrobacter tropicus]|uniref:DUF1524 domain-containing protein n=1 Tax=Rubrobacter tropicus TaxID=2653851 RepID=A0A6G8QAQ9_9ACTN|nr:HNH endonuclease family protein [Rubrobacter tropicus]QIN83512.1 DUF1524 domain-containing protein [Rubrobacter tropicus]